MIGDLSNELCRLISLYKNRVGLFQWNGQKRPFLMKDIVRHHLFSKAESSGFTPIPNVHFLNWTYDLICLKGTRPEYVFVIRENITEDFRQLLLFPKTTERVLVALTRRAIPEEPNDDITLIVVSRTPTSEINASLSVKKIIGDYSGAFREIYGFPPIFAYSQMVSPANRLTNFWLSKAADLNFREYCIWFMTMRQANRDDPNVDRVVDIKDLFDKNALATFRVKKAETTYDDRWTQTGWTGLDS